MSEPTPPAPTPDESDDPMLAQRQSLPPVRDSVTHKFAIMGHEGYLTVGLHPDGMPGEIFVKMAKEGSTLSGLIQGFCRAFSLALQYGLPPHEAVRRFKGMRFEPMGATSNPDIPECSSIIDYVARFIEVNFIDADDE
ncbi:MAG: hypothetical protein ACOC1G_03310 [Phycisphaeraceae bacterium]